MYLSASFRKVDGVVVVYIRGKILFGNEVETISRQVSAISSSSRSVVLELSSLADLRSGDLGSLWLQYMQAHTAGWRIKVCALPRSIGQLMAAAKIDSVFEIYPSEAEAIAAFQVEDDPAIVGRSPAA